MAASAESSGPAAAVEPKPLREFADDVFIRRMERAQGRSRGALRRHFAAGLDNLRAEISVDDVLAAIRERRPEDVVDDRWEEFSAELRIPLTASAEAVRILEDESAPLAELFALKDSQLAQTWMAAARAVARLDPSEVDSSNEAPVEPLAQVDFRFEALRPVALRYVEIHGAEQVVAITSSTKEALRLLMRRAWEEGSTAGQLQRAIFSLEGADGAARLGLSPRQQQIFERWIDSNLAEGTWADWSQARIQQAIDRRYTGMVRRRSQLIAQTESLTAGNKGQLSTWQAQVEQGAVDPNEWLLEWVTRLVNVCLRCVAMDSATRRIESGGMFVSDGSGPKGVETAEHPDLHPGGYCVTRRMPARLVAPPRDV